MKNIVIVSTTLRNNGNSDILAKEFARGAIDAGNSVEIVSLKDKKISYCIGCLACQKTGKCVINDDAIEIANKIEKADVVVFATPVYFYDMCGQMKTLLDRLNPLYISDYKFRDIYLIATAGMNDKSAVDGTITGLNGWISCFGKANLAGVVHGVGVTNCGDASSKEELMVTYYNMGRNA